MFWESGSGCSFHTAVFILNLSKKIMFLPQQSQHQFNDRIWFISTRPSRVLLVKFHGFWHLKQEENCRIIVRHLVTSCELDYYYMVQKAQGFLYDDVSRWKQRKRRCRCDCAAVDKMATAHCGYVAKSSSYRFSRQSL